MRTAVPGGPLPPVTMVPPLPWFPEALCGPLPLWALVLGVGCLGLALWGLWTRPAR
jgi:hypothetical protein